MIIRIVKMTFKPELVQEFENLFDERKEKIRQMPGCSHLELLQDVQNSSIFFTYSFWNSEADLEQYRQSEFFKDTWQKTKALFSEKANAWSVTQKHKL